MFSELFSTLYVSLYDIKSTKHTSSGLLGGIISYMWRFDISSSDSVDNWLRSRLLLVVVRADRHLFASVHGHFHFLRNEELGVWSGDPVRRLWAQGAANHSLTTVTFDSISGIRHSHLLIVCISAWNVAAATYLLIVSICIVTVELSDIQTGSTHVWRTAGAKYRLIVNAQLGLSLVILPKSIYHLVWITSVWVPALDGPRHVWRLSQDIVHVARSSVRLRKHHVVCFGRLNRTATPCMRLFVS